jgi:hypothetical protein
MSKAPQSLHAAWLADFAPAEEPLPAPQAAMLAKIKKQFPKAKAGKRTSRNGVLHWYLIDPQLGPMAGPLQ